jgi:small subunit ribosomal protein S1
MTAGADIEKSWEEERMYKESRGAEKFNGPLEPDEGWWAAVLADEPLIEDLDNPDELPTIADLGVDKVESMQANPFVDWDKIERIFDQDEIVELTVVGHNRGGILVAGEDIHGFVPASHLVDLPTDLSDDNRELYLSDYLDRKVDLKVIECEKEKERVVFSERAALAEEGQRKYLLNSLKKGDIIPGTVTNVTSFGAFVDLGGLEGLIHISELSWGRVTHPSEVIAVGDEIQTMVLQVEEDEGKIALSLKRLQENPWEILVARRSPGDILEARITCIVKYGAFAKIEGGVEGLIHISSMEIPENCKKVDDFLYEGQRVLVKILNIDANKRRLGLQLESCLGDNG